MIVHATLDVQCANHIVVSFEKNKWVINGNIAMTSYVLGVGQPTLTNAEQMAEGFMCTSTNAPAGLA